MQVAGTERSKLFISYSRADLAFTNELIAGLESLTEFEILIDREGIGHGEDWRARLGRLIFECDTMIFVLTPESVTSEVCAWEIGEARRHSKRIIPVLWRAVDFGAMPADLSALNAVPFDAAHAVSGLPKLVTALKQDLGWLREHTRLGERAAEWEASGRTSAYLLRGDALSAARDWLASKPASAPAPTALLLAFLQAGEADESRQLGEERRRREELEQAKAFAESERDAAQQARAREAKASRRLVGATTAGLIVALVLLVAAASAGWLAQRRAEDARLAATKAAAAAEDAEGRRRAAQLIQSRFLARAAQGYLQRGDVANALGLARAALPSTPSEPDRPFAIEAAQLIFDAYGKLHERATLRGHGRGITGALWLPDDRVLTWARDGTLRFWHADGELQRIVVAHKHPTQPDGGDDTGVHGVLRLDDGRLLSWGVDKTAKLWRDDGSAIETFLTEADWIRLERLRDGRIAATVGDEYRVWGAALEPQVVLRSPLPWIRGAILLADGRFLTWQSQLRSPARHTAMLWRADGTPGRELSGHDRMLQGAFELADGRLVTFDQRPNLRIWSAAGGLEKVIDKAHKHASFTGPFGFALRDGGFYTWGQEAYHDRVYWARLWNVKGESHALVEASETPLQGMQLDDGRLLLGINSATPAIWRTDGTRGPLLRGHEAPAYAAAQWPDGRIATHGADHTARLWSRDGDPLRVLRGHEGGVSGVEPLPDARYLTWSFHDRTARIWSDEALPRSHIDLAGGEPRGVQALHDGTLALHTGRSEIALHTADLRPTRVLRHEGREIDELLQLADGRLLTRGRNHSNRKPGPALRLWRPSGELITDLAGAEVEFARVFQAPSGQIMGFELTGRVWRWEADGRLIDKRDPDGGGPLYFVHALADGRFVTRQGAHGLQLWSAEGLPVRLLGADDALMPSDIVTFGGGRLLAIDQRSRHASVWDEHGARWQALDLGGDVMARSATRLSDGKLLLNLFDGRLLVLNPDLSWRDVTTPASGEKGQVPFPSIIKLADGRLLVARSRQGAQLWRADGTPDRRIADHAIDGAILLQDGSLLAWPVAGDPRALQIIGADGTPGAVLRGHAGEVKRALQLADGRILSWAGDGSVRAWPGSVAQAMAWADDVVARLTPLTHAERCEHYLELPEDCH